MLCILKSSGAESRERPKVNYNFPMGFTRDQVLIIMPAKNEEAVIASVIAEVKNTLGAVEVLVINDGSTDHTSVRAREAGATVLDLPFNLGVGGAMRLGYRYARSMGFKAAVQLDSDGQHDPADVPKLLKALERTDVAIGARFIGTGNYEVSGPRKWAMKFLSTFLSRIIGTQLNDTTSGFKAHNERAIAVFAEDYPAEYLGDTIEALLIGHRAGLTFEQIGVSMRERAGGTPSHNPLKSAIYLGRAMLAVVIAFLRPKRKNVIS